MIYHISRSPRSYLRKVASILACRYKLTNRFKCIPMSTSSHRAVFQLLYNITPMEWSHNKRVTWNIRGLLYEENREPRRMQAYYISRIMDTVHYFQWYVKRRFQSNIRELRRRCVRCAMTFVNHNIWKCNLFIKFRQHLIAMSELKIMVSTVHTFQSINGETLAFAHCISRWRCL